MGTVTFWLLGVAGTLLSFISASVRSPITSPGPSSSQRQRRESSSVATWGFLACCNWLVQVEYLNLQAHAQALAKVLYTL